MRAMRGTARREGLFWAVAAVVVLADQFVKAWVRQALPEVGDRAAFLPGILRLQHVENTGAAFSLGEGRGLVFVVVALAILVAAAVWVAHDELPAALVVSVACVAGGGVGNMLDRLLQGSVTDFFATEFMDFPVFNVADIGVTCGIVVSVLLYLRWDDSGSQGEAGDSRHPRHLGGDGGPAGGGRG